MSHWIPQPAVALNAFDMDEKPNTQGNYEYSVGGKRFKMLSGGKIEGIDIVEAECLPEIVNKVVGRALMTRRGKLRSLVINSHGNIGRLRIGEGITMQNVHNLAPLNGKVERVYLTACLVGCDNEGFNFCNRIATIVNAIVFAPEDLQFLDHQKRISKFLTFRIDSFEGFVYEFKPNCSPIRNTRLSQPIDDEEERYIGL